MIEKICFKIGNEGVYVEYNEIWSRIKKATKHKISQ